MLIVLVGYNRPKTITNALNSICKLNYDNWRLAVIDDGSMPALKEVVLQEMGQRLDKVRYYYVPYATKCACGKHEKVKHGSKHGRFMNQAIQQCSADVVVILCDDDALHADGLTHLNEYYQANPAAMYAYSHVIAYNPEIQRYIEGTDIDNWFNRTTLMVNPSCVVDSSQVTFRRECFVEDGLKFNENQTHALDADIFIDAAKLYGPAAFTGGIVQYKAIFPDQMSTRTDPYNPRDITP